MGSHGHDDMVSMMYSVNVTDKPGDDDDDHHHHHDHCSCLDLDRCS